MQAPSCRLVASMLVLPALLAGCTISISVPLSPALDLPPVSARLPLEVGVYYSREFREYEAVELVGLHGESRWIRPLGQASVRAFDQALSSLFERVVPVASPAPVAEDRLTIAAVIEPRIEGANFGPPNRGFGWGSAVWSEITYGLSIYSPKGDLIGSWKVVGLGEAETHAFRERQVLGRATDLAIQDALTKFVKGFRDVPEVRRWLRELGGRSAGLKNAGKPSLARDARRRRAS